MLYSLVGYGISNKQLSKVLLAMGHEVFISEARTLTSEDKSELESLGIAYEENQNSERILKADRIVVSPSVPPNHPVVSKAPEKVLTDIDVILSNKMPSCVIGVTGTNGKTTTCSMINHVLLRAGKKSVCLGNVGNPVATLWDKEIECLVLELSSFQLFWSKGFSVDIGVILNISPNHLDWHPSFEHYCQSKLKLFDFSKVRIFNEQDALLTSAAMHYDNSIGFSCAKASYDDKTVELFGKKYLFDNPSLYTSQNLWNLSATIQVLKVLGFSEKETLEFLEDFSPPKHRMQLVAQIGGVSFYNDSKSTSSAATIAALRNFEDGKVILILTGRGKNEDYTALIETVLRKAKTVVVFGEMAKLLVPALMSRGAAVEIVENMESAVKTAYSMACPGDVVLFSPGGSSFDLYKNYEERGEHFETMVKSVVGG